MGSYDELIGDTLAMVNVVRRAFGKDALTELPDATPGNASDCLFYRALSDIGARSVSGSHVSFADSRAASTVATLWGAEQLGGDTVALPHQFTEVISAFDGHRLPHYVANGYDGQE